MDSQYTYLRLSVTDRCNLDCSYCRPSLKNIILKDQEILSLQETLLLTKELIRRGVRHVRLTGGEPLLRPGLADFASKLSSDPALKLFSLTTNGVVLREMASGLKECGINKLNISLDTLKSERFLKLTGFDYFERVISGVVEASGLWPGHVKINCLVIKGFNDDEILDFVAFGEQNNIDVRFIEFFQTSGSCDSAKQSFFSSSDVRRKIEASFGKLQSLGEDPFCGPARYYRIKGHACRIGFISSVSDFFCGTCNRLRLTSDGKLFPCLYSDYYADLKRPLRRGDTEGLSDLISDIIGNKKVFNKTVCNKLIEMSSIGG